MRTIFDLYSEDDIENIIDRIFILMDDKYKDNEILDKLNSQFGKELISIAKARIRNEKDFSQDIGDALYYNEDDLRFSTPKVVADFRANRLKCKRIVDLCSGVGIQAGSFSNTCSEVLAIEIDPRKVKYSEMNFENKNLKFVCGDVLNDKIIRMVKEFQPDIIFCDPERLASEKERTLDTIQPDIKKLIEVYSNITPNLCIELPPRIEISKISGINSEKEYLSFNNKLNRLQLYFGKLKDCETSVADVITGKRFQKKESKKDIQEIKEPMKFIQEISEAIVKAELVNEFSEEIKSSLIGNCEKNKILLTSENNYTGEFNCLMNSYRFLGSFRYLEEVNKFLKLNRFGKAVIKYSIHPNEYWKERKKIEYSLLGRKEATIFALDNKGRKTYLVTEKME